MLHKRIRVDVPEQILDLPARTLGRPARPRFARAPVPARHLVQHPRDNPKIANARLTPVLTLPPLLVIIAG